MHELFDEKYLIKKIKEKLPYLFQLAEIDNSRDGKLGMEIGSARERIVIALLIYKFGEENIKTDIGITESETDVIVFDEPISIKTVTNKKIVGVKLIWTVDAQKALEFINNYSPNCDILFVHINWGGKGAMYLLSKEGQQEILSKHGKEFYFKLPKQGTNPRGVEITNEAINKLVEHPTTKKIEIDWSRDDSVDYNAYDRWVDHWKEE
ncbi:MAG: type II restriction endonuclease subunit R [Candidatus Magasanikbacteria bacterium CG_4_10_14_0_2_um_filter_33_14]|uniref:Type II restriction endonuclease subunit R n=1 Tax=Candidatus Magasanikbacteria bacterium CG_4_10_14_0_2_um_filter_33_14 TaxID=1974636 RepID=A0A2M7V9G1_9BACT|nr:MAG: type II restriction endonuclease subunit R [Candidatus Magasanikbacteria bacterium CG_4_10_14_0_2_um_filter_33_14]